MPIRFRCAYCNQLMGIARRKAGTVVRCPKCAGQVVVPQPDDSDDHANDMDNAAGLQDSSEPASLFEHSDFGKIFEPRAAAAPPAPAPAVLPKTGAATFDRAALEPASISDAKRRQRGIFLTSGMLVVVCALTVVLMGLAFFLGLLLGKSAGS